MPNPDGGPKRGIKEVDQLLKETVDDKNKISQAVADEAGVLLNDLGPKLSSMELDNDSIRKFLEAMIVNTSLSEAKIEVRVDKPKMMGRIITEPSMPQMILGKYGSDGGSYNVWFEQDGDQLVIACDKIPKGGNLRS